MSEYEFNKKVGDGEIVNTVDLPGEDDMGKRLSHEDLLLDTCQVDRAGSGDQLKSYEKWDTILIFDTTAKVDIYSFLSRVV